MIEESAQILSCDEQFAIVETEVQTACGGCQSQHSCGTSVLAGLFKNRHNRLRVLNPIQAKPGERVIIGLREQALVQASLMAYLLPLVCMIGLAIAADRFGVSLGWTDTELFSILAGLLGLLGGLLLLNWFTRRHRHDAAYQAVVLRLQTGIPTRVVPSQPAAWKT